MIEDAIILAGGFGTRLHPLTLERPKPLLPVGNRPFLETQFYRLKEAGVRRVVLSVFQQPQIMRRALPKLKRFGLKVTICKEPKPLGTGGAVAYAWPNPKKPCLVLNGDILSDLDLKPLIQAHEKAGLDATLWCIEVEETSAFGVLECEASGRIQRFVEKPKPGESQSRTINAGLYALEPSILKLVPKGRMVSIERETFPRLLTEGRGAQIYVASERPYWNDIGTPASYLRANLDALDGRLKLGSLWSGLKGESVLGPACKIAKNAKVTGSVLLEGCKVGSGAQLDGVILGAHCEIGARVRLKPGALLGAGSRVTEGSHA